MPLNSGTSPLLPRGNTFEIIIKDSKYIHNTGNFSLGKGTAAVNQGLNLVNQYISFNDKTGQYEIKNVSDRALDLRANIENIVKNSQSWPQVVRGSSLKVPGFLPSMLVGPVKDFASDPSKLKYDTASDFVQNDKLISKKYGEYEFTDWRGYKIKPGGLSTVLDVNTTENRFKESASLPRTKDRKTDFSALKDKPYSTRDHYLLFNDNATDYFKHGLQIIDNLGGIEDNKSQDSLMRLSQFKNTPFENNDPVMFGFEIVFDTIGSPLLNGSIIDFLNQYTQISELRSRIPVYEDFKHQFIKFFKTAGSVNVDTDRAMLSKNKTNYANTEAHKNDVDFFSARGRKPYLNYYLKKVGGLANLVEANTPETKKFLVDYRKDIITLAFTEDVSLSVSTLAHLYKLLYWSKPNGKSLIPENLLRFNCDIIVSECRNFNRVRKALSGPADTIITSRNAIGEALSNIGGNLEIIKDNVSRYVYSLKECQFYFNTMAHNQDIDLSAIATYDEYSFQFDYKYSTVKFERFAPTTDGFGQYVGYDGGAIWKVGNPGERSNRGTQSNSGLDTSKPRFYTVGGNKWNQNGSDKALVLQYFGNVVSTSQSQSKFPKPDTSTYDTGEPDLEGLKDVNNQSSTAAKAQADLDKEIKAAKEITDAPKDVINTKGLSLEFVNAIENSNFASKTLKDLTAKGSGFSPQNFIERLKDQTVKSVKQELKTLVDGRVSLLSRTINKLLIGQVGGKGISPPQNIYTGPQDPMGIAMTNIKDRFFYDVRNDLADFAGGALSDLLNGGISKITKK